MKQKRAVRTILVPVAFVGAMGLGIVNTPLVEAGGWCTPGADLGLPSNLSKDGTPCPDKELSDITKESTRPYQIAGGIAVGLVVIITERFMRRNTYKDNSLI